jgi:hypothetical protein
MSTLWWLVVLALACPTCGALGYVLRAELETWRRAGMIDFDRKPVGE